MLRLRDSDEVIALDGVGAQYHVRLAIEGKQVRGKVVAPATARHEPERRVALPKGERWEWLPRKGTEIGVARFVPVVARYSQSGTAVIRPRHREVVREATKQCRRLLVPPIEEPRPFADVLTSATRAADTSIVLLWEGAGESNLTEALHTAKERSMGYMQILVGPEGGFHPDEVALARDVGVPLAGLGPLIPRTETAAFIAAALALNA